MGKQMCQYLSMTGYVSILKLYKDFSEIGGVVLAYLTVLKPLCFA